jgi:hypothetical protein
MFALPSLIPETDPVEFTEAIFGSELVQTPFNVVFASVIFDPTLTDDKPDVLLIEGSELTIVEIVFDEAGLPIAHSLLELNVAYTASPLVKSIVE